jgi:hypothetical protein
MLTDVDGYRYDFTPADSKYQLIASISGSYSGDNLTEFGHPSVARALRKLNAKIDKDKTLHLECQAGCLKLLIVLFSER